MDNQHRLVSGYREFTQSELDTINSIKLAEQDIGQLWQQVRALPGVDQRCLAEAKTGLQAAFSWFVRAVAKPIDVFELVLPEVPEPSKQDLLRQMELDANQLYNDMVAMQQDPAYLCADARHKNAIDKLAQSSLQFFSMINGVSQDGHPYTYPLCTVAEDQEDPNHVHLGPKPAN